MYFTRLALLLLAAGSFWGCTRFNLDQATYEPPIIPERFFVLKMSGTRIFTDRAENVVGSAQVTSECKIIETSKARCSEVVKYDLLKGVNPGLQEEITYDWTFTYGDEGKITVSRTSGGLTVNGLFKGSAAQLNGRGKVPGGSPDTKLEVRFHALTPRSFYQVDIYKFMLAQAGRSVTIWQTL